MEVLMLYNTLHNRSLRILACVFGEFLAAAGLNLFLVPLNLYSGGIMGVCQLIRSVLTLLFDLDFGTLNIAGILYFLFNIPILILGYLTLGKKLVGKTLICTASYSLFCSIIPISTVPVIDDTLTSCLLAGILIGAGCGIVLTCGGSSGGLDMIGLCLNKRGIHLTIGKFSLGFNALLYTICLLLFSPAVAIYSVIYNFTCCMMMDRAHQQSINVQALIYTRTDGLEHYIMETLGRGVTYWQGVGGYTGEGVRVLSVCLSKYEIEELLHAVHAIDPHAFIAVQEGVRVYGNYQRKL